MTDKQNKLIQALLITPSKTEAAKITGLSRQTIARYFQNPAFVEAYRAAVNDSFEESTRKLQKAFNGAIDALVDVINKEESSDSAKIAAARSILEYGLKMTELHDILRLLEGGN